MHALRASVPVLLFLGGCAEMANPSPGGGRFEPIDTAAVPRREAAPRAAADKDEARPVARAKAPRTPAEVSPEARAEPEPRMAPEPSTDDLALAEAPAARPSSVTSVGDVTHPSSGLSFDAVEAGGKGAPSRDRPPAKAKRPPTRRAGRVAASDAPAIDMRRAMPAPDPALVPPPRRAPPASPGLSAGAADDNLSFGAFLSFLRAMQFQTPVPHDVSERVVVSVVDRDGRPLNDARVMLRDGPDRQVRHTYADGRTLVFPRGLRQDGQRARGQGCALDVRYGGERKVLALAPGRRKVTVALDVARPRIEKVSLDIAFVLDTTGSMDDELARLKQTIDVIDFQVRNLHPRPDVRFGMVLYRDIGDEYRTRKVPFTRDLRTFRRALAEVRAGGGNDYPEDVQEGLRVAMQELKWREDGVRLAFLVGDAPPHVDYEQPYTYVSAMQDAARRGIKIATIGASGLSKPGEAAWRQIAQYTMAPFVFLTYGEKGDSEGSPSAVSHHVGSNWVAQDLDAIVVRLVKTEIAHLSLRGAPTRDDYFSAGASATLPADDVLEDLFSQSVRQLVDYAVERIDPRTPTVVLPLTGTLPGRGRAKLARRLEVGLARAPSFQLVERGGKKQLLAALAGQLEAAYDEARATEVGRLVPARLAVLGHVAEGEKGKHELLVKLVRLETGEVLSLSLLRIEDALLM